MCWIRSSEPRALRIVADVLAEGGRLVHVLGSAAAFDEVSVDDLETRPRLAYQQVVLGSVREGGGSRWLSHEEISAGVLAAVEGGGRLYAAGEVDLRAERSS